MPEKLSHRLSLGGKRQMAIVIHRANPHIIHEQWEANHQPKHTKGSAEFEVICVFHAILDKRLGSVRGMAVGRPVRLFYFGLILHLLSSASTASLAGISHLASD